MTPGEGDLVETQRTVSYVNGRLKHPAPHCGSCRGEPDRPSTTLSRHVLTELGALGLPHLQTAIGEAVAYAEIGFTGAVPKDGAPGKEVAALLAELRAAGGIP